MHRRLSALVVNRGRASARKVGFISISEFSSRCPSSLLDAREALRSLGSGSVLGKRRCDRSMEIVFDNPRRRNALSGKMMIGMALF